MITTYIELYDQLVTVQDSQNAPKEMAAILITTSAQRQTQF